MIFTLNEDFILKKNNDEKFSRFSLKKRNNEF